MLVVAKFAKYTRFISPPETGCRGLCKAKNIKFASQPNDYDL